MQSHRESEIFFTIILSVLRIEKKERESHLEEYLILQL